MTPRACSLYDWIKLYTLKMGYSPCLSDIPARYSADNLKELAKNYWLKVEDIRKQGHRPIFGAIKLLR